MNAESFDPAAADAAPDIGNDLKGTSKEMNVEVTQVSKKLRRHLNFTQVSVNFHQFIVTVIRSGFGVLWVHKWE